MTYCAYAILKKCDYSQRSRLIYFTHTIRYRANISFSVLFRRHSDTHPKLTSKKRSTNNLLRYLLSVQELILNYLL